jgi:hypothetical protein
MKTEKLTYPGNPRAHMNEWIKHELSFFPGVQKLDKLLFQTSFTQIPNDVVLLPYDSRTNDIIEVEKPFGETNSARHSNVRVDMAASRYNPGRSISFIAATETQPAEVIQTGTRNNGITVATRSTIDVDKTGEKPSGVTQLQHILLVTENDNETVQIKLRMDPDKKQVWYTLSKLDNTTKEVVNIHLAELQKDEVQEKIYYVSATISGEDVLIPIPESLIPMEKFPEQKKTV